MKTCSNIENLLPLYEEGVLSDAEKRLVEEHLAHCDACFRELADLRKAAALVRGLPEAALPPWFEQKIMAQVRREAESRAKNWFWPLRFKIPVSIAATLVIAVLAVFIYRTGEEPVQSVLPGAPPPAALETMRQTAPAPPPESAKKEAPAPQKKAPALPRPEEDSKAVSAENLADVAAPAAAPVPAAIPEAVETGKDKALDIFSAGQKGIGSGEKRSEMRERSPDRAPAAPAAVLPSPVRLTLRVENPAAAAADVEKIFKQVGARNITQRPMGEGIAVSADLSAEKWKTVRAALGKIGPAVESSGAADEASGGIAATVVLTSR
ncbi:MAG: zf-HC2 domain-containing protein [Smithellaceae bacterium]|nr:zf-HC2 domain-containing protein [Smithellaceae bacterium]